MFLVYQQYETKLEIVERGELKPLRSTQANRNVKY